MTFKNDRCEVEDKAHSEELSNAHLIAPGIEGGRVSRKGIRLILDF